MSLNLTSPQVTYDITYHVVWCTKYMRPVLEGEFSARLEDLIREKAAEMHGHIYKIEIRPACVYIVCSFPPNLAPNQIAFGLKDYTAHVLRQEFAWLTTRLPNLWTRSYYFGTGEEANHLRIEQFLKEQEAINRPPSGTDNLLKDRGVTPDHRS